MNGFWTHEYQDALGGVISYQCPLGSLSVDYQMQTILLSWVTPWPQQGPISGGRSDQRCKGN